MENKVKGQSSMSYQVIRKKKPDRPWWRAALMSLLLFAVIVALLQWLWRMLG